MSEYKVGYFPRSSGGEYQSTAYVTIAEDHKSAEGNDKYSDEHVHLLWDSERGWVESPSIFEYRNFVPHYVYPEVKKQMERDAHHALDESFADVTFIERGQSWEEVPGFPNVLALRVWAIG